MNAAAPQQADAPNEIELCRFPAEGENLAARLYACGGGAEHYANIRIEIGDKRISMTPKQWANLGTEVETQRMQLAACGVVAMCNTPESAKLQRPSEDSPYWCASLRDVAQAVDREMALREQVQELAALVQKHDRAVWDLQRLALSCPKCNGTGHVFRDGGCWSCGPCSGVRASLVYSHRPIIGLDTEPGTKVVFANGLAGRDGDVIHAKKTLELGKVYTVARMSVGECTSSVELEQQSGSFNTVQFSLARADEVAA